MLEMEVKWGLKLKFKHPGLNAVYSPLLGLHWDCFMIYNLTIPLSLLIEEFVIL